MTIIRVFIWDYVYTVCYIYYSFWSKEYVLHDAGFKWALFDLYIIVFQTQLVDKSVS
jgi:hypothetical protein